MSRPSSRLPELVERFHDELLETWTSIQLQSSSRRRDLISDAELRAQATALLAAMRPALARDASDVHGADWKPVRQHLEDISRSRARQGFSPSETAMFVFSMKQVLSTVLRRELKATELADELWNMNVVLDQLGLYTTEIYQKAREEVISRQQAEMLELSTPVVELWQGVLALPLIGTLDSRRTQTVMETLLRRIVETGSEFAIIDITGVPTVDTLTAQHLIKTITATRLMGAECIISGIRPQIAQTIVHLGVDLGDVVTKSTLAGALELALRRRGLAVRKREAPANGG
jgi:rsbT co-antagonist protein RsbR